MECLAALSITLGVGLIVFQLLQQNTALFNDQNMLTATQQNARVVISQITDDLRLAGQETPVFAASFDAAPYEATVAILNGSGPARINFRSGLSGVDTNVVASLPLDLTVNSTRTLYVGSAALLATTVGSLPTGKFVFIWGAGPNSCWGWARALIQGVSTASNSVTITTQQIGDGCRNPGLDGILGDADDFERFTYPPTLSLEEATEIYFSAGSVLSASASNMTNPASPAWSAAQELGQNIAFLAFTYYDKNGNVVTPSTLANRASIVRIDVAVVAQTSQPLSTGSIRSFPLAARVNPTNLGLH